MKQFGSRSGPTLCLIWIQTDCKCHQQTAFGGKIIKQTCSKQDGVDNTCNCILAEENVLLTNSPVSRTQPGGYFKPVNCEASETVAVIVPYRDREEHLKTFLDYMHPFLQRQPIQYIIYVVEMVRTTNVFVRLLLLFS